MQRILLVEDDCDFREAVRINLARSGIDVASASTPAEAARFLQESSFDLILLDINLPGRTGIEVFMDLKRDASLKNIPVIFLTGEHDIGKKITAFSLGAEDYLVKPVDPLELRARVEAKLRKCANQSGESVLDFGEISINPVAQKTQIETDGKRVAVSLTRLEFKILLHLARAPERIFTREQLLDTVWGGEVHVTDRAVDVHVCGLRKKLGRFGKCVESVPGSGYRFVKPSAARVRGGKAA